MSWSVSKAFPFLLFSLLTARWWWVLARGLWSDLRAAGSHYPALGRPEAPSTRLAPEVVDTSRVPLNRLLAFQGVPLRRAARRRWEAGFGRRGL
jgi:hypothetical protein